MVKAIKGKDGKFAGSIGEGKSAVPTPASLPRPRPVAPAPSAEPVGTNAVYAAYQSVSRSSQEQAADTYRKSLETFLQTSNLSDLQRLSSAAREYATFPHGRDEVQTDGARFFGSTLGMMLADEAEQARRTAASVSQAKAVSDAGQAAGTPHRLSPMTTPGGWTLSGHIRQQAALKGISEADLVAAVDSPHTAYESHKYPGQLKHTRNGIAVAVDPAARKAITVFVDRVHTDLRADQTDKDAQAYAEKRRKEQGEGQ